jgi:phage/plasmid-associated DNA primase
MESNPKIRKEIYDKILNPIFSENEIIRDSFLYEMSQTIAGNYQRKTWYCLEGVRNSGKGIISDCLFNAFQNYVSLTNADNFIYKDSNGDSAKSLSFLTDFEFSRLVITQEISLKENGKTLLDGNRIKKFVSGGDKIEARKNYQDEKRFKLQCSLMLCCNDLPTRNPADCNEFLKHYLFNSKFIGDNEEKKYDHIKYYKKDETLKTNFLMREEVMNEFTLILLEHYNKKVELPKQQEEVEEEDDTAKLYNIFDFTNRESDKISNSDLYHIVLQDKKIPFTKNKISRLLRSKGAKQININNKRGFSGIKLKEIGEFE